MEPPNSGLFRVSHFSFVERLSSSQKISPMGYPILGGFPVLDGCMYMYTSQEVYIFSFRLLCPLGGVYFLGHSTSWLHHSEHAQLFPAPQSFSSNSHEHAENDCHIP